MSQHTFDKVSTRFPDALAERYADRSGAPWAVVKPDRLCEVARYLKEELDYRLFLSCDAVDRLHLPASEPRFEVVYFLASVTRRDTVRLKVRVGGENPEVPSLVGVYQGANWWERLIWDFYGIRFGGHPDLRRMMMYEEFKGHPLRKDYPLRGRQPLVPERPIQDLFRGPGTSGVQ